jgi:hypothetical protein
MSPSCVGGWAFDSAQVTNHAQPVVWFPAIPNLNEMLIHLNGLRYPWDSLRLLRYARYKPQSIAIQSVVFPPEYWDTGVGVLLFSEMGRRLAAKGCQWADLSLTGEEEADTWPLAHRMGAKSTSATGIMRKLCEDIS